jgi:hypothetical protein
MRVASEEIATEGRARQLEVTVAEGPIVRIAFPPAGSLEPKDRELFLSARNRAGVPMRAQSPRSSLVTASMHAG